VPRQPVAALVEHATAGDFRALAKLISLVEDGAGPLREVMSLLARGPDRHASSA
jgi:putative protein kinase ArgK-like GTPase of G3E family